MTSANHNSNGSSHEQRPRVALLVNTVTPYRNYVHQRIVDELPEIELWSLYTHDNSYNRWSDITAPESIRPVSFSSGEPINEKVKLRFAAREWRKAGRIIRWLKENNIAAVVCEGLGNVGLLRVLRWCSRNNVPCLLYGDFNGRGDRARGLRRQFKKLIYGRGIGWASAVMPCGEYGKELFDNYGGKSKPLFWYPYISNPAEFEHAKPEALDRVRARFDFLRSDRRRIVVPGRMMRVKRHDLAIGALAALAEERPNWELVFIGDGALREQTEKSVPNAIADRVHFCGFLDNPDDVSAVFASSDVMLLPSDHEPWGMVMMEAALAGLAIVATDVVGAAPELVKPGRNGATFPVGDLDALVDVLRETTDEMSVEQRGAESRKVFYEWLAGSDPVQGLAQGLSHFGVLPLGESKHLPSHSPADETAAGHLASKPPPLVSAANNT